MAKMTREQMDQYEKFEATDGELKIKFGSENAMIYLSLTKVKKSVLIEVLNQLGKQFGFVIIPGFSTTLEELMSMLCTPCDGQLQ